MFENGGLPGYIAWHHFPCLVKTKNSNNIYQSPGHDQSEHCACISALQAKIKTCSIKFYQVIYTSNSFLVYSQICFYFLRPCNKLGPFPTLKKSRVPHNMGARQSRALIAFSRLQITMFIFSIFLVEKSSTKMINSRWRRV